MLRGDFWRIPKDEGCCQANKPCDWSVGIFCNIPRSLGRGEGLDIELITNGQRFNQSYVHDDVYKKS